MVAVTTRAGKGSPLTNAEIDANWNALVADLNTKMTQAQARAAISVSGSLTYNSTTGVLGFTETPLTSANIVAALGFTPLSNAGGTLSGGLTVNGTLTQQGNQVLHAGNYNSYSPSLTGSGASGTWGINITGNAATVGGIGAGSFLRKDISNTVFEGQGSALSFENQSSFFRFAFNEVRFYDWQNGQDILTLNGNISTPNYFVGRWDSSGRNYSREWIEFPNASGLYSPINGAHFYPNDGTYGAWRINGSRNGWRGIEFDGAVQLMMNDNESGHHRQGYGWQFRWYNGTLYNYKNAYGGGTEAVVLDASNYTNYAAAASHSHSYVPLGGGTMSGALTLPGMTVSSTAPQINMQDTDQGTTRYLHVNGNLMGFLKTDGNWDLYANNSGQVWSANYGWLHDYFFSAVSNCATFGYVAPPSSGNTGNCYNAPGNCNTLVANCGNMVANAVVLEDSGATVSSRTYRYNYNCNCNCDCCCCFAPGTLVLMADGSIKPIEAVAVGEKVVGLHGSEAVVAHTFDTTIKTNSLFLVNGELQVTGGHLFKVEDGWAAVDMAVYPHGVFFRSRQFFESGELTDVQHQNDVAEPVRALRIGDVVNGVAIRSIELLQANADQNVHNLIINGSDGFILASGYAVDGFMRQTCGVSK